MDAQRFGTPNIPDSLAPDTILSNWTSAIYSLHQHYQTLSHCVQPLRPQTIQLDDSFKVAIASLLHTIEQELNALLVDLDQSNQSPSEKDYQKLIEHTERLNKLNQRAQLYCSLLL